MKVLLFIDTLGSGGAQRQLVNLGIGLKAKGHDVSLLTYNKPFHFKELLDENEIKHFHIQKKGKIGFNLFKAISSPEPVLTITNLASITGGAKTSPLTFTVHKTEPLF